MSNIAITRRWKVLGGALALTLMATGWLAAGESAGSDVAEAVAAPRRPETAQAGPVPPAPGDIRLDQLRRQRGGDGVRDVFAARSWQPAAAPAAVYEPAPAPAAAPEVPAQPFVYTGKMLYEGTTKVFVANQGRVFVVQEGDVVDGMYRIDSIKGPLMEWTYLPLDMKQTMHIGEQN